MRNFRILFLYIFLFLSVFCTLSAKISQVTVDLHVNGKSISEIRVLSENGLNMVDHKVFSESLQSKVYVSPYGMGITDYQNGSFSLIIPGKKYAFADGRMVQLDIPTVIFEGDYFTSIEYLSWYFDADCEINSETLNVSAKIPFHVFEMPERIEYFADRLEDLGFILTVGSVVQGFPLDYFAAGYTPDCNGNNANNPYLSIQVPPSPFQNFSNNFPFSYRIAEDEALLLIGMTPPQCEYFSYRSYILNRWNEIEKTRKKIFASLGDTVNLTGISDGIFNESPFEKPIILISTASPLVGELIRAAAYSSGFHYENIFFDIIPADILNLGIDAESDELSFLHRVTLFADEDEKKEFLDNPTYILLRVTPKEPIVSFCHDTPPLKIRGGGDTEMPFLKALDSLQDRIISKYSGSDFKVYGTGIWIGEGYPAIINCENVLGEVRDTLYLKSENFVLGDDEGEFLAVIGVDHSKTLKSVYSNFSIYGAEFFNGLGGISNHDYSGTAGEYLPDDPLSEYLYIWFISRNEIDGEKNVYLVPEDAIPYGIPTEDEVFIGFRSYMEIETQIGPVIQELIPDRVIHFKPAQ